MIPTAQAIAAVLSLVPTPASFAELDARVAHGLPKGALRASVNRVCDTAEQRTRLLHRIVPVASYKRRRTALTPDESGKTERLARVFATAVEVWDSEPDAQAFLTTPHAMLEGRSPLDVALTEIGARRVEQLLARLYYGIPA
jgi:putative toxin-antitoxin system antitoxin component (TIGR02293 family)